MGQRLDRNLSMLSLIGLMILAAGQSAAQTPSIEGTYRLVSRTMNDGTVIKPPEVMGLLTYTKEYRQFILVAKDKDGKITSRCIVSTYKLTPTEYIETPLFHVFVRDKEVQNLTEQPQKSAVKLDGGKIALQLERRSSVFEGKTFTATSPMNTDLWEKID